MLGYSKIATPMPTNGNIVELRQVLTSKFPHLRQGTEGPRLTRNQSTGVASLDALLSGGIPGGEMTELVGNGDGAGSAQVICSLLEHIAKEDRFMALIDGTDSFDAGAMEPEVLTRLLWVRCSTTTEALKSADLLLRDRNHSLVV